MTKIPIIPKFYCKFCCRPLKGMLSGCSCQKPKKWKNPAYKRRCVDGPRKRKVKK
ncbi:MAG TPA: hypothetical protein VJ438_02235 [Candidatus Nanoarchaeia archaeon]|nr:hypothetical protein [Candidatus Nanoarchaeia archaeon]